MKAYIIIPILNEVDLVAEALEFLAKELLKIKEDKIFFEVVVVDGGSLDGSQLVTGKICERLNFKFITRKLENPSIAKTIEIAFPIVKGGTLLILPIDCSLLSSCFDILGKTLIEGVFDYGGFSKKYSEDTRILSLYCFFQNIFRSKLLNNLVWTNGIWMRGDRININNVFSKEGFMEDVFLSDKLKNYKFIFLKEKILVSARRYIQDKVIKRIFINFLIILIFRLGYRNTKKLKRIYRLFE